MIVDFGNGIIMEEKRSYDSFGRLLAIDNGSQKLSYEYNTRGRIIKQRANGVDIVFGYDKLGRLKTKCLGSVKMPISKIEYFYGANNQIAAREVNGVKQQYAYDELGQLLSVAAGGKVLEQYKYDPAGNMLSKTINGKVTTFKYDASNQLVSSTCDGKNTSYEYDAAGRMIQEGSTFYRYNFNNKVVKSGNNTYNYYASGQIANASVNGKNEEFSWDGLALLERNGTNYLNEPYATGGNPVLADKKVLFNDLLGTTQGVKSGDKYTATPRTAFDVNKASLSSEAYRVGGFTGKPHIEGLGSVFLFRNYRPELSKWQTSDPLGYPDGWNNLAYENNEVNITFDPLGLTSIGDYFDSDGIRYTFAGWELVATYTFVIEADSTHHITKSYYSVFRAKWNWQCIIPDCTDPVHGDNGVVYSTGRVGGTVTTTGEVMHYQGVTYSGGTIPSPTGGTIPTGTLGVTGYSGGSGAAPTSSVTAPTPIPSDHVHE